MRGFDSRRHLHKKCLGGGTGIRTGLKILGPQGIEGSSPSPGTMIIKFMNQKTLTIIVGIVIAGLAVAAIYFVVGKDKTAPEPALVSIETIFGMSQKIPGTQIYYSEKLGVGFTYVPKVSDTVTAQVTEIGDKIYMHLLGEKPETGQSVEVFTKDPELSLEEAITARFLAGYDPNDCFVRAYESGNLRVNYASAGISFPRPADANAPWWQNSEKCPPHYSEINAVQYFLMNQEVPDKFLFVSAGQDMITSDGTPIKDNAGYSWINSLQILK